MEKMKAVILVKNGNPHEAFDIKQVAVPSPGPNQVLVKVEGFGLNFADVMARRGLYKDAPPIPCVLGYDIVGQIVEVGEGVPNQNIGKTIVALTRFGGYAEYAIANMEGLAIVEEPFNWGQVLALGTQYCTAYYASHVLTNLIEGEVVLVHSAAGGVGIALAQLAKNAGCRVIGATGSKEKIEFIERELGVDYVINYNDKDYVNDLTSNFGKKPVDISFNAVGGRFFKKDFSLLKPTGRIVCYGASSRISSKFGMISNLLMLKDFGFYSPIFLMMGSRSILGVNMLRVSEQKPKIISYCLDKVVNLLKNKEISPFVAREFNATNIGEAHEFLESRKSIGKVVVKW